MGKFFRQIVFSGNIEPSSLVSKSIDNECVPSMLLQNDTKKGCIAIATHPVNIQLCLSVDLIRG